MPKPNSKNELIELSRGNYMKLLELINSYPKGKVEKEFPEGPMNRNVRDVLAHLHHWHLMMLKWYEVGMNGEKPDMPAKGYTWKTLPDLNKKIWEDYQDVRLETVQGFLADSFQEIQDIIDSHSDEELFEKRRFKWTGTTSLGAYLISNTSSHYDWAIKRIKKSLK